MWRGGMIGVAGLFLLGALLQGCSTAPPVSVPEAPVAASPMPAPLAAIAERGRQMFVLDRAAWVATDDLRAHPDPNRWKKGGWVVELGPDGSVVTFYGRDGDAYFVVYTVALQSGKVTGRQIPDPGSRKPLTPAQARMAKAREAASGAIQARPCTDGPYNTVVIPPQGADDPIDVYIMSPQTSLDFYPFGGHSLVRVRADGSIASKRDFTKACVNLNLRPALPKGDTPVALGVTHLLDPVPTEIHVFISMATGMPLYVMTAAGLWSVDGDQIRMLDKGPPREGAPG